MKSERMSFLFWGVLFHLLAGSQTIVCPTGYNLILRGCYKLYNGSSMTWSNAQQYCLNDSKFIVTNSTGFVTHLVALESAVETTSLIYWMKAWSIQTEFWTDGLVGSSSWSWSDQAITWYFNSSNQIFHGNGSNYQLVYSSSQRTYDIEDQTADRATHFICEYQDRCSSNHSCQNNATCYLNVGQELCLCAPGFTGTLCDREIDECLSSPCLHGGLCSDALDNYTCDCSQTFFTGPNCETEGADPSGGQRSAAFWTVVGVVCGLVVLLTLSDLPWDEIVLTIGCPWYKFKCCSSAADGDDEFNINALPLSDSPTTDSAMVTQQIPVPGASSRGVNYHIMNTVWNPEHLRTDSPSNPQYNGYQSPDLQTTPNNLHIQSFAAAVLAKKKEQQNDEKRVYAVDIVGDQEQAVRPKHPADTMVSWTKQLQEQLKNNSQAARPTSASSTKELIHSEVHNEDQ